MRVVVLILLAACTSFAMAKRDSNRIPTAAAFLNGDELRDLLNGALNNSHTIRARRSTRSRSSLYSHAVIHTAVSELFPSRVRREVGPEDTVKELSPWVRDLETIRQIFEDIRDNPDLNPGDHQDATAVLNTIEQKIDEMGSLMQKYKTALYSSVVHPLDDLKIKALTSVIQMIDEVNKENFTVPIIAHAAHAVSGLYISNVQNMVIIGGLEDKRVELKKQLAGKSGIGEKDQRELETLRSQVAQAKNMLKDALGSVGLQTSAEVESMNEIIELAKAVQDTMRQAERLARHALRLSEMIGSTSTADYQALQGYAEKVGRREREGRARTNISNVPQGDSGESERGCRRDIAVEKNSENEVVKIGGEWAHKTLGMFPLSTNWMYDYRGDCVMPAPDSERRGEMEVKLRGKRGVRNWGKLTALEVMELAGKVMAQATTWTERTRRTCESCLSNARSCVSPSWCRPV